MVSQQRKKLLERQSSQQLKTSFFKQQITKQRALEKEALEKEAEEQKKAETQKATLQSEITKLETEIKGLNDKFRRSARETAELGRLQTELGVLRPYYEAIFKSGGYYQDISSILSQAKQQGAKAYSISYKSASNRRAQQPKIPEGAKVIKTEYVNGKKIITYEIPITTKEGVTEQVKSTSTTPSSFVGPTKGTYDVATGVYTDPYGNKQSAISAPAGAKVVDTSKIQEITKKITLSTGQSKVDLRTPIVDKESIVLVKPSEVSLVKPGVKYGIVGRGRDVLSLGKKGEAVIKTVNIDEYSDIFPTSKLREGINIKQPNIIQENTLIGEWMGVTSPYEFGGSQYGIKYPKGQEPVVDISKVPQYVESGINKVIEVVGENKYLDLLDISMYGGWLGDFTTSQGVTIPSTLDVISYPSRKVDEIVDAYKDYSAQEDNIFTFGFTEEQKADTKLRERGRFYREEVFATAMRLTPYLIPYVGVALSISDIAKGIQQIRNPEDEKRVINRIVDEVYNQYSLDYENEEKNLEEGYELEPKLTKDEIRELISQEITNKIQVQGALNIVGGVGDIISSGVRALIKRYVPRKKFLGMSEKQFEKFQVNKLKSEEMLADLDVETSKLYKERYKLLTGLNYLEEPTEGFIKTLNTEYIGSGKKILTPKEIKIVSEEIGQISKEIDTPLQIDEVGKFNIESEIGITKRLKLIGGEGLDLVQETELPSLTKYGFPESKISQRVLISTSKKGDEILGGGISYVVGSQDRAINKELFTLYGKGKKGVLFQFYEKGRKSKYFQETDAGKLLIEYEPFAVITKRQLTKSKKIFTEELDDEIIKSIYKTKYIDIPTARENVDIIDFMTSLNKKKLNLKGYSRGEKLSEYINIPQDKSIKLDIDISGTDLKSVGRGKVIDVTEYINIGKQYPRGTIFTGLDKVDDITSFTGGGKKSSQKYLQELYQENIALPEIQIKPPRVKVKPIISKVVTKSGFDIPLATEIVGVRLPTLSAKQLEYPRDITATSLRESQLTSQTSEQDLKNELGMKVKSQSRERDLDVSTYLTGQTQQQRQSQLQKSEQSNKLKLKQIQDIVAPDINIVPTAFRNRIEPPEIKLKFRFDLPEQKQIPKKKIKQEAYNVYVKVPKKKSYSKITNKPVSKRDAENLREFAIDQSTSRQGYIKKVKTKPSKLPYDIPPTYSQDNDFKFRTFKQEKGKKVPLINRVIEKSKYIQDTRNEKKDLSVFRTLSRVEKKKINKLNKPFGLGFA